MSSKTEFYRQRLQARDKQVKLLIEKQENITGKKRKYEEAMNYKNDYEVVQFSDEYTVNKNEYWKDAYLENRQTNKHL